MINETQNIALWEKIKHIKVAMMSTCDQGMIRSRPMHLVQHHYDGTIWFFVRTDSANVTEIEKDPAVNLAFMDRDEEVYVSMSGLARVSLDADLKRELWNPIVDTWFPDGPESDEVAALEIQVDFAEYWDAKSNKMLQLLDMALAKMNNKTPNLGDHQKFS